MTNDLKIHTAFARFALLSGLSDENVLVSSQGR